MRRKKTVKQNMIIDARTGEITDTLKKLKELFPTHSKESEPFEVLVLNNKDAGKIMAFAAMSGFKAELYHKEEQYTVHITGSSCGCFR